MIDQYENMAARWIEINWKCMRDILPFMSLEDQQEGRQRSEQQRIIDGQSLNDFYSASSDRHATRGFLLVRGNEAIGYLLCRLGVMPEDHQTPILLIPYVYLTKAARGPLFGRVIEKISAVAEESPVECIAWGPMSTIMASIAKKIKPVLSEGLHRVQLKSLNLLKKPKRRISEKALNCASTKILVCDTIG